MSDKKDAFVRSWKVVWLLAVETSSQLASVWKGKGYTDVDSNYGVFLLSYRLSNATFSLLESHHLYLVTKYSHFVFFLILSIYGNGLNSHKNIWQVKLEWIAHPLLLVTFKCSKANIAEVIFILRLMEQSYKTLKNVERKSQLNIIHLLLECRQHKKKFVFKKNKKLGKTSFFQEEIQPFDNCQQELQILMRFCVFMLRVN